MVLVLVLVYYRYMARTQGCGVELILETVEMVWYITDTFPDIKGLELTLGTLQVVWYIT